MRGPCRHGERAVPRYDLASHHIKGSELISGDGESSQHLYGACERLPAPKQHSPPSASRGDDAMGRSGPFFLVIQIVRDFPPARGIRLAIQAVDIPDHLALGDPMDQ